MKGVRGGGRKKIEGTQPKVRLDDEENVVGAAGTEAAEEFIGAEREVREFAGDDDGEEDEEEDEEEEDEKGGGGGEEEEEEGERPKLDEGFYEIEDVRRKRVRKGQIQYLIKWRGWPEAANTWEPLENLQSCSDIIEAFEESLRSGRHRSSRYSRKRKRKHGGSHTEAKKKQRPTSTLPGVKVGSGHQPVLSASLENSSLSKFPPSERMEAGKASDHKDHGHFSEVAQCVVVLPAENVSTNIPLENDQIKEADPICSKLKGTFTDQSNARKFSTHVSDTRTLDGDGLKDGLTKVECADPAQSSRFTGAKKRKSGFVRRFRQDSTSHGLDEAQNTIARCTIDSGDRFEAIEVEDAESLGDDAGDKNKLDDLANPSSITKIIKPIGYSASISNNVQDVSVTFVAMRSDGREVVVDSKFLKANNPLLLISFYEQHLRYTPPT